LVSIVKPGIIEYIPSEDQTQLCKSNEFVFNKEKLSVSISKGFVFTDGKVVTVTTSCASKKPNQPIHTLQQMKQDCEVKLKKIKNQ
jgi:F0F1-type ATP synthase epsilon subunit